MKNTLFFSEGFRGFHQTLKMLVIPAPLFPNVHTSGEEEMLEDLEKEVRAARLGTRCIENTSHEPENKRVVCRLPGMHERHASALLQRVKHFRSCCTQRAVPSDYIQLVPTMGRCSRDNGPNKSPRLQTPTAAQMTGKDQ